MHALPSHLTPSVTEHGAMPVNTQLVQPLSKLLGDLNASTAHDHHDTQQLQVTELLQAAVYH
jgi:hypothetical protein